MYSLLPADVDKLRIIIFWLWL